jgi:hypothetical protein
MDLTGPAVHRVLEDNRAADVPLLLTACEHLLEAKRVAEATEVWNGMAEAGKVPFRTPAGEGEQLVANSDFATPPASRGFDWRLPSVDGVSASREGDSHGLRITFSGREPEDCEVLVQMVPVRTEMRYELKFVYRTRGIASGQGLGWRIACASGDAGAGPVVGEVPGGASEEDTEGRLMFETPAGCRMVRLALRYRRSPGTTRMEGFLILRKVTMNPPAQLPIAGSRVRK